MTSCCLFWRHILNENIYSIIDNLSYHFNHDFFFYNQKRLTHSEKFTMPHSVDTLLYVVDSLKTSLLWHTQNTFRVQRLLNKSTPVQLNLQIIWNKWFIMNENMKGIFSSKTKYILYFDTFLFGWMMHKIFFS